MGSRLIQVLKINRKTCGGGRNSVCTTKKATVARRVQHHWAWNLFLGREMSKGNVLKEALLRHKSPERPTKPEKQKTTTQKWAWKNNWGEKKKCPHR